MTRNGKIARLPPGIRKELNQKLDGGAQGPRLLAWLNGLPEVQAAAKEHFGGRLVNSQNLSKWRLGGFQDWKLEQSVLDRAFAEIQGLKLAMRGPAPAGPGGAAGGVGSREAWERLQKIKALDGLLTGLRAGNQPESTPGGAGGLEDFEKQGGKSA